MKAIRLLSACLLTLGFFICPPARADWPSAETVVKTVAPAAGLTKDQTEFVLFALKKPDCASTIVIYTAAEDYSLAVFIAALKGAKLENIPEIPKMSQGQCKAYSPLQQAYIVMDTVGDKLAGNAGPLKQSIKNEIEEGKTSLNAEVATVPYVGTILTNWDCACDAAYMTHFESEKMVNQAVGDVVAIGNYVQSGDIPSALERMVKVLGPEAACKFGAQWTGLGSVPIVSDFAAKSCGGIASGAADWVVSGAGTLAEAAGLIGGDHIPPEEYYAGHHAKQLKPDWRDWISVLYDNCYKYFEPTNMSASTAKKVCTVLQQRFIDENEGREQRDAWAKDPAFGKDYLAQQARGAVFLGDEQYKQLVASIDSACESYAAQKYPKIKIYEKNYDNPVTPYDPQYCSPELVMDGARAKEQENRVYDMIHKQAPFCKKGQDRNAVVCDSQGIKGCFADFAGVCKKSMMKKGGMEAPCCQLGAATDDVFKSMAGMADKVAKKESPYCRTQDGDPLRVSCAVKESYDHCLKAKGILGYLSDCGKTEKYPNGTPKDVCCAYDPSWLDSVAGVKEAKGFMIASNLQYKDSCGLGGMQKGFGYDPRIVHCASGKPLDSCAAKFPGECKKLASGFVENPCCDAAVFAAYGGDDKKKAYDPHSRSEEDLALTEKAVSGSHGQCHYGKTKDGKEDRFKVVCDTIAAGDMCLKVLGRPAQTSCPDKTAENGWVTSPCCERSPKALQADLRDTDGKDIKAPAAGEAFGKETSLAPKQKAEGTGAHKEQGARLMGTAKRTPAPEGGLSAPGKTSPKTLGGLGGQAGRQNRGTAPSVSGASPGRAGSSGSAGRSTSSAPDGARDPGAGEEAPAEPYKP